MAPQTGAHQKVLILRCRYFFSLKWVFTSSSGTYVHDTNKQARTGTNISTGLT
jgi:hypothetical protein